MVDNQLQARTRVNQGIKSQRDDIPNHQTSEEFKCAVHIQLPGVKIYNFLPKQYYSQYSYYIKCANKKCNMKNTTLIDQSDQYYTFFNTTVSKKCNTNLIGRCTCGCYRNAAGTQPSIFQIWVPNRRWSSLSRLQHFNVSRTVWLSTEGVSEVCFNVGECRPQ